MTLPQNGNEPLHYDVVHKHVYTAQNSYLGRRSL